MKSQLRLFSFVAASLMAFAVIHKTEARATKYIEVEEPPAEDAKYILLIDKDEERRLSELLQHDFGEIALTGTYTTHPPQLCPRCGKETEFIDWVYTALARGVHTREWLVEALRERRIGKKAGHDVYCSRCGHLTAFQDSTGAEGQMADISQANQYDHTAKSFGHHARKRDVAERAPGWASEFGWTYEDVAVAHHDTVAERAPGWASEFGWTYDDVSAVVERAPGWAGGFGWTYDDIDRDDSAAPSDPKENSVAV